MEKALKQTSLDDEVLSALSITQEFYSGDIQRAIRRMRKSVGDDRPLKSQDVNSMLRSFEIKGKISARKDGDYRYFKLCDSEQDSLVSELYDEHYPE